MSEKKGILASLFGGKGCDCGMKVEEETAPEKMPTKKSGCCDIQIVDETESESSTDQTGGGCCCGEE